MPYNILKIYYKYDGSSFKKLKRADSKKKKKQPGLTLDSMVSLPTPQRNLSQARAELSTTRASGNMFTQEPSCNRSNNTRQVGKGRNHKEVIDGCITL